MVSRFQIRQPATCSSTTIFWTSRRDIGFGTRYHGGISCITSLKARSDLPPYVGADRIAEGKAEGKGRGVGALRPGHGDGQERGQLHPFAGTATDIQQYGEVDRIAAKFGENGFKPTSSSARQAEELRPLGASQTDENLPMKP